MRAACLIPRLLLFVLKAAEDNQPMMFPLGMVLAAAWLTNAPAAVMVHYSLGLLILFFAVREWSARLLLVGAGAVAIGAGLASFYLLPAVYEQKWVNIAEAVSAGSRPADNFLFMHTTDPDHDAFNRVISWVAVLEMVVTFLGVVSARIWRRIDTRVWNALLLWGVWCGVLLFPMSLVLWKLLPKLQFMQFPWRWLLCLSAIFTIFVALGLQRWWSRALVCVASILVIMGAWVHVQAPWWDNAADLREMQDNMEAGVGYEGTDEYTPVGADPAAVEKNSRNVTVIGPARAAIHILRWDATAKEFTAQMSAGDELALKLFRYPAWKIELNGHPAEPIARQAAGQMLIAVQPGMNHVQIRFIRTWDRTAGSVISGLFCGLLLFWFLWPTPHRLSSTGRTNGK
jgi:hypothetical protein